MSLNLKAGAIAIGLSLLGGAALAAEQMDCCCKDKDGAMSCCDKMKDKAGQPKPAPTPAAPEDHKH